MATTIAQRELRNDNARIVAAVAAGETFVVTRNGAPVAELRPVGHRRRTFVPRDEIVATATTGVRIDRGAFRADVDAVADQSAFA